jgi:hypothetical protein
MADQSLLETKCLVRARAFGIEWVAAFDYDEFFVGNFDDTIVVVVVVVRLVVVGDWLNSTVPTYTQIQRQTTKLPMYVQSLDERVAIVILEMFQCRVQLCDVGMTKVLTRVVGTTTINVHDGNSFVSYAMLLLLLCVVVIQ